MSPTSTLPSTDAVDVALGVLVGHTSHAADAQDTAEFERRYREAGKALLRLSPDVAAGVALRACMVLAVLGWPFQNAGSAS